MRYVILGASAAGINGARQLRKHCKEAEIVLISKDKSIYSRCILHHYLGGIRTKEELCFAEADFESKYQVKWKKGLTCTGIDEAAKTLELSDGTKLTYDRLLIATGSSSFLPPVEGLREASGVFGFHNLSEAEALKEGAASARHIVVMGGGLVGLDAADGFLHAGKTVSLVEMETHVLAKQLDRRSAGTYEKAMEKAGIHLYLGSGIQKVCRGRQGEVVSLILTDGKELPCDLLAVTVGVRPNVDFLKNTRLLLKGRGLEIDAYGQTNVPDIYGAGDVTGGSPIWPAAVKQGMIAADNMAGIKTSMDDFFSSKATMNFFDIPTMSLGISEMPDDTYSQVVEDHGDQYRKIIHKNGKIFGAILQGDLSYGGVLTQLIAGNIDVSRVKKPLFAVDYSDFFHEKENFEFYYEETT